jgi:hypothetical protein
MFIKQVSFLDKFLLESFEYVMPRLEYIKLIQYPRVKSCNIDASTLRHQQLMELYYYLHVFISFNMEFLPIVLR